MRIVFDPRQIFPIIFYNIQVHLDTWPFQDTNFFVCKLLFHRFSCKSFVNRFNILSTV